VPFYDVDTMGVVWHGNYLKYFERARLALLDECGVDLYDTRVPSGYLFPIVRSSVKHVHPLRLRDRFVCRARLIAADRKLVMDFEIRLVEGNRLCARGRTEQVAIRADNFEMQLAIPAEIRDALLGDRGE
jgi:acyl-CoA thioester hydrolase